MALKNIEQIKKDVRVILDEDENIEALTDMVSDSDALQTDAITEAMILKAVDKVHEMAPLAYVSTAAVKLILPWEEGEYCSEVKLPSDFLRLVSIKAKSWKKQINAVVEETSSEYMQQQSDFAGIRATKRMPVAAIVTASGGGNKLECYPKEPKKAGPMYNPDITVMYIEKSKWVERNNGQGGTDEPTETPGDIPMDGLNRPTDDVTEMPMSDAGGETEIVVKVADRCYDAMLYMVANLYYQTIGEADKSRLMAAEAAEMMGMKVVES